MIQQIVDYYLFYFFLLAIISVYGQMYIHVPHSPNHCFFHWNSRQLYSTAQAFNQTIRFLRLLLWFFFQSKNVYNPDIPDTHFQNSKQIMVMNDSFIRGPSRRTNIVTDIFLRIFIMFKAFALCIVHWAHNRQWTFSNNAMTRLTDSTIKLKANVHTNPELFQTEQSLFSFSFHFIQL